MKKLLTTLLIAAASMMAQEATQGITLDKNGLKKLILDEFCSGHAPPEEFDEDGNFIPYHKPTPQEFANDLHIPPEGMVMLLEEIIRERLPALQQAAAAKEERYNNIAIEILGTVNMLKIFHGPNTLALLKDCVQTKDSGINRNATETYIHLLGGKGDTVPFLHNVIEKKSLDGYDRRMLYKNLNEVVLKLQQANQNDDMDKLHGFMLEMVRTEQDPSAFEALDDGLRSSLDNYSNSVQREQGIQKFLNSENEWTRNRFNEIKSEIEKVPVDKRTDLNRRLKITN